MPKTIQSFFDRVRNAASILGETETIELVTKIQNQNIASKLRLLILGATGSGRFSVTNVLLRQPELLPISSVPKAAIGLNIGYGEIVTVELSAKNGIKTAIPVENIRNFFTSPDTDVSKYHSVEIKTKSEILKTCEIKVENIAAKRSINEWKEILAGTDYVILVIKAVALLSEQERDFIRNILNPYFGLERVMIFINHMDMVPDDEYSSISELVRSFLGKFEAQPILIELSAAKIRKSIQEDKRNSSTYGGFLEILISDLLEKHGQLKLAAMHKAVDICLSEVEQAAKRQNFLIATNEVDLQKLLLKIDSENNFLQQRIQNFHHKAESSINTLLKEEFLREIENFGFAIKNQLADEIMPIEDITTIKRHLPGYIEALWTDFFNVTISDVRTELISEIQLISEAINKDFQEMLGDTDIDLEKSLNNFDPIPGNMMNLLMPKRSNNSVGNIATGLQLGGFLLLITNLPLGLAAIGAGQVTRMVGKKGLETSEKEAITESAIDAINELEKRVKKEVNVNFQNLTLQIKLAITDLYNQKNSQVRQSLKSALQSHQELVANKEQISYLINVVIPELRQIADKIIQ